jgi:hypothetical protein
MSSQILYDPYDPVNPLLDIYSKEPKAGTQTGVCTLHYLLYYL